MKIVIAGGQAGTRRAVSLYLRTRLGVEVVGETGDLEVLMKLVKANQPDLVILDTELPSLQLSTLIPTLGRLDCPPAVIVLNGQSETEVEALAAGADAFVYKGDHPKELLLAIQNLQFGRQG